jgi:glutathione peroxidase
MSECTILRRTRMQHDILNAHDFVCGTSFERFAMSTSEEKMAEIGETVHDFSAETLDGRTQSLSEFKNKVLLIVNTASQCGFTPQYAGLESLYRTYNERGLVVLGFPCNQFGAQEPGSAADIGAFCEKNYGVSFPMFAKIDVNGDNAHPLYRFLKKQKPGLLGPLGAGAIKWNFTKFLIDRSGTVVARYASTTKPENLAKDIEKLL